MVDRCAQFWFWMPPAAHLACARRCFVQRALVRVCRRPALLEATHAMTDVHVHPDALHRCTCYGEAMAGSAAFSSSMRTPTPM